MSRSRDLFENPAPGVFHSAHLATVISLKDPDNLARVQIRLLNFDGVESHDGPVWARVAAPFAGKDRGAFWIPDVGDEVLVTFINGDSRLPVVIGGLWNGTSKSPKTISEGQNRFKVLRSKNGVQITLDDQEGQEQCIIETPAGQKITLKDRPAQILIEDAANNSIKMEASGITVHGAAKVTVDAPSVEVTAGSVRVATAMATFTGHIRCEGLHTNLVESRTYTPGIGNVM